MNVWIIQNHEYGHIIGVFSSFKKARGSLLQNEYDGDMTLENRGNGLYAVGTKNQVDVDFYIEKEKVL